MLLLVPGLGHFLHAGKLSKMTYFYRKHNISMKNSMQNVCVVLKDETYLKPEIVLLDVTTEHGFYFDHLPPGS